MKKTELNPMHIVPGAKMVPFAGYEMPVQYEGINTEHSTVRNAVGVFDVSHMGEFLVKGNRALDLIQKISTNDASILVDGGAQYSCMTNLHGGIIDDLLVYRLKENEYLLVVNASNINKDWNWINQRNEGATLENISDQTSLLAVQGPYAAEVLQKLTDVDLCLIKNYTFVIGEIAGVDNTIISATGYTGAGGFEIYVANTHALHLWRELFKAGNSYGIKPIGLGARDTLRLEMGYCLYGNDINDNFTPVEAGLSWITKFNKQFNGYENLLQQKTEGTGQKRIGFKMIDRQIPRHNNFIVDDEGKRIGMVTSGTQSSTLQKGIGVGYVESGFAQEGTEIWIEIRNKMARAVTVSLPFLKNATE